MNIFIFMEVFNNPRQNHYCTDSQFSGVGMSSIKLETPWSQFLVFYLYQYIEPTFFQCIHVNQMDENDKLSSLCKGVKNDRKRNKTLREYNFSARNAKAFILISKVGVTGWLRG